MQRRGPIRRECQAEERGGQRKGWTQDKAK